MNAPPSIFDIRERAAPIQANIAGPVPVLCSPASDRVTGGILFVDGGRAAE